MLLWKNADEVNITKVLRIGRNAVAVLKDALNKDAPITRPTVVSLTASTQMRTALHEGKTLVLNGTGAALTQTLPASVGLGARYRFVVGAVNTSNHIIKTSGSDVMRGNVFTNSTTDNPDLAQPWPAGGGTTITLNGTTTGGQAIGDSIELIDIAAGVWAVLGHTTTSGVEATPFS